MDTKEKLTGAKKRSCKRQKTTTVVPTTQDGDGDSAAGSEKDEGMTSENSTRRSKTARGAFINWKAAHNTLKDGERYQHAHSHQGRYDEFMHLDLFPFVAQHGFGVESFQSWAAAR
jgi:hypothetical protein